MLMMVGTSCITISFRNDGLRGVGGGNSLFGVDYVSGPEKKLLTVEEFSDKVYENWEHWVLYYRNIE